MDYSGTWDKHSVSDRITPSSKTSDVKPFSRRRLSTRRRVNGPGVGDVSIDHMVNGRTVAVLVETIYPFL